MLFIIFLVLPFACLHQNDNDNQDNGQNYRQLSHNPCLCWACSADLKLFVES